MVALGTTKLTLSDCHGRAKHDHDIEIYKV